MIPPFDHNYVLPPYVGDNPTQRAAQSPYHTDIMDLCKHFGTTHSRVDILNKLKGMNVNIQNLYAQSNFQIIRTECEQDKVLLEDFCNRLDKFSYKKIGASVFVK